MILIVTGGRNFRDRECVAFGIDQFQHHVGRIDLLVEGGASGADTLARDYASEIGIHVATIKAQWKRGPGAGPVRNRAMLHVKPDAVLAYPGNNGTRNMIETAAAAGIPVYGMFEHNGGWLMRLLRVGPEWVGSELEDTP